jgi:hypothetical protein
VVMCRLGGGGCGYRPYSGEDKGKKTNKSRPQCQSMKDRRRSSYGTSDAMMAVAVY